MCELLAMSANVPTDICFSFTGLMQRGGKTGPHSDGWGINFYEGKGCRSFKDPLPSAESQIAQLVQTYPIKSENVVCHIRQANSGEVCLENTHPFMRTLWGRYWSYAHNGQLENYQQVLSTKRQIRVGKTDSEQAFCFILEQLENNFGLEQPSPEQLFTKVASLCKQINLLGVYNLILSDGVHLFAYCANNLHWLTRRAPFGQASLIDAEVIVDFQQETTDKDIVSVIATAPLTDNEGWHKMSPGEWLVFRLGDVIFQGKA
jgi:glutamine amidotransferase